MEGNDKIMLDLDTEVKTPCTDIGVLQLRRQLHYIRDKMGMDNSHFLQLLSTLLVDKKEDIENGSVDDFMKKDYRFTMTGEQKINAIKEFRTLTGMGLKESKDFIEGQSFISISGRDLIDYKKALSQHGRFIAR